MQRSMKIQCSLLIAAGLFLASRAALADELGLLSRHGFGMSIGAGVTESNTSSLDGATTCSPCRSGAGIDVRFDPLVLDARVAVRPTFDNELLPDSRAPGNPTRLDSASLLVRVGFEF